MNASVNHIANLSSTFEVVRFNEAIGVIESRAVEYGRDTRVLFAALPIAVFARVEGERQSFSIFNVARPFVTFGTCVPLMMTSQATNSIVTRVMSSAVAAWI